MADEPTSAQQLAELIEGIDIAMLTTTGPQGYLVSRPLSTQDASFDGQRLWFFTEADSPKVGEIRRNRKVNVAYASKESNVYVSVAGEARISDDRAKIDALWNDALKAFFPRGKDDPNLVLLEVAVRSAEYWTGPRTGIGKLISFVVARVTKKEEVMGENRILDLRGGAKTSLRPPSDKAARGRSKSAAKAAAKKVLSGRGGSTRGTSATSKSTGRAAKSAAGSHGSKSTGGAKSTRAVKSNTRTTTGRAAKKSAVKSTSRARTR